MGTNIYARLHPDSQERKKLALKIKDVLGIEKALELTDFSRSELESGKLNNR